MTSIINQIINFLKNNISSEFAIAIISMVPIVELRGAIPLGIGLGMPFTRAVIISYIGSTIPAFFIILLIGYVFKILRKIKFMDKLINKINEKTLKNKYKIEKYGYWGLLLFVGIPLPGTGIWTGSLLSHLLNMDKKKSFVAVALGNVLAGLIIAIVSGTFFNLVR